MRNQVNKAWYTHSLTWRVRGAAQVVILLLDTGGSTRGECHPGKALPTCIRPPHVLLHFQEDGFIPFCAKCTTLFGITLVGLF